jgi:hypothetical protein
MHWRTGELQTGFWRGNLKERKLEDLGVYFGIILKWILKK